jgi:hypothetical protein
MWCRVDLVNWTEFSEERIASIFRVEKSAREEPAWAVGCKLSSQKTVLFNVKIDLKEIGWDGMEWIDLAQDRN